MGAVRAFGQAVFSQASASRPVAEASDGAWWKHALIYEIYPRSFQDSNGDGIGDLNGITQRLGYLESLGVDAVWLTPIYPSPQVDFGYDISNYESIDPQYGTLADFDRLVAEARRHHIRIVMDMVMNHTSDQHQWFLESASSKTNPKRDWYVWRDPKGFDAAGKPIPPNNWVSGFGGSAWQYDPTTKQFYYHEFYRQQPDLNWRNPEVEKAMFGAVRFWLDRGVAGFRLDAIPNLFEDPQMRDNPVLTGTNAQGDPNLGDLYTNNLPEVHDVIRRLRTLASSYPGDRVLIGETYLPNVQELEKWYGGPQRDELELPMDMQVGMTDKLDAKLLRQRIDDAETKLDGNRPLFVFDNHDNPRSWDRYSVGVKDEGQKGKIARLIATLLLTSKAAAMMYYGEELGMVTSTPLHKEDVKDPIGITGWPKDKGRDGERTPMQWDDAKDAGFSTSDRTWLPVASDYKTVNVHAEEADSQSLLNWYKRLIAMRRSDAVLRDGAMEMIDTDSSAVLAYVRKGVGGLPSVVVALNLASEPQTIALNVGAGAGTGPVTTLLTDASELRSNASLTLTLPAYAAWVGTVASAK
jgi:alpha-glucosidase